MSISISVLFRKFRRFYALNIERLLFLNWFNPFMSLYVNFRLCSIKDALHLPIWVYGWPRLLSLYGNVKFPNGRKFGQVRLNRMWHVAGGPNNAGCSSEFNIWGTWIFEGSCSIGTDCKICIGDNGILSVGNNCLIMTDCNITAYKEVALGDNLLMAHSSQILDTSYHFVENLDNGTVKSNTTPIRIGNNCWICNNVSIMGGVSIPDSVIVASHSLVNKTLNGLLPDSLIGGIPANILSKRVRRIVDHKEEYSLGKYFMDNPEAAWFSKN